MKSGKVALPAPEQVHAPDQTLLYYERRGQGASLVLCDGLLCDGHIWNYFSPDLENDFELIHWHYPGHGKSEEPGPYTDLSPKWLSDCLASVMRHAGRPSATVIGHSLGVQVALETWNRHRELVNGLVLICGAPGRIVETFHDTALLSYLVPMLDAVGRFTPDLVSSLWKGMPSQLVFWLAVKLREVNRRLIRKSDMMSYLEGLKRVDFRVAVRMLESAGLHDAAPYLKDVDVPVLVIGGEEDSFTPPALSRHIASCIVG
jgi:pimeloyl-ACP methyl ester carboxylesterase